MRQRKIKDVEIKIREYDYMTIHDPAAAKGRWHEIFGNDNPIYLELGCGKGQFICRNKRKYPERNFIAVEGHMSVCYRAMLNASGDDHRMDERSIAFNEGKAEEMAEIIENGEADLFKEQRKPDNIRFIREYIENITDYFEDNELAGIYLNFSDPWPKARHEKRRLTYGGRLLQYEQIIEDGGFIQFKTDNDPLFEYSLEQIEEKALDMEEMSRDLHHSDYLEGNITTEYEDKFNSRGKNINYFKIRVHHD